MAKMMPLQLRMICRLTMRHFDFVAHVPQTEASQTRMDTDVWHCGTCGTEKHIPYIAEYIPLNYGDEYTLLTRKRKCANLCHSATTPRKPAWILDFFVALDVPQRATSI